MQNRTLLTAVAAAAFVAIATPSISQAQDTTRATSKGEVATMPNFGSLISAINATASTNAKLKGMTTIEAANVQLVNVEDLLKGNNVEALNNALKKNEADLSTLRSTLGGNTTVSSSLTTNATPLAATDIVASEIGADGKVVVYYWKKPA